MGPPTSHDMTARRVLHKLGNQNKTFGIEWHGEQTNKEDLLLAPITMRSSCWVGLNCCQTICVSIYRWVLNTRRISIYARNAKQVSQIWPNLGSNHISIHKIQCILSPVSSYITKKTNKDTIPSSVFFPGEVNFHSIPCLNITPTYL